MDAPTVPSNRWFRRRTWLLVTWLLLVVNITWADVAFIVSINHYGTDYYVHLYGTHPGGTWGGLNVRHLPEEASDDLIRADLHWLCFQPRRVRVRCRCWRGEYWLCQAMKTVGGLAARRTARGWRTGWMQPKKKKKKHTGRGRLNEDSKEQRTQLENGTQPPGGGHLGWSW